MFEQEAAIHSPETWVLGHCSVFQWQAMTLLRDGEGKMAPQWGLRTTRMIKTERNKMVILKRQTAPYFTTVF